MPKFDVDVMVDITCQVRITVEADDADKALRKAWDLVSEGGLTMTEAAFRVKHHAKAAKVALRNFIRSRLVAEDDFEGFEPDKVYFDGGVYACVLHDGDGNVVE